MVCYRCDTVYRDAEPTGRQPPVDLLKHDVIKYGKTWTPQKPKLGRDEARRGGDDAPPA